MAELVHEELEALEIGGRERPRLSWGAIFGGAFSALGVWLLLYAFGLAVGLSTINPNNASSLKSSGVFTGIWSLVTTLASLFVGGMVAARGSGTASRSSGALHGLVMWGLATAAGTYFLIMALGAVIGGVASVGRAAAEAGGSAIGAAVSDGKFLGLDADDALGPVNARLRAEGKPRVTAAQLQDAAKDALQTTARTGQFDRDALERSLARNTALSRKDVDEIATRLEAQWENARGQVGEHLQGAQTGALKVVEASGKAFWGLFAAMLLGLIAALGGALLGVVPGGDAGGGLRRRRAMLRTPPPLPRPPAIPTREVYP
jgi:hypothetical protein